MTEVTGAALAMLHDWLPANRESERPQIQLATVDAEQRPDVRTVLLSEWDEHGFVFHTDRASRKATQLAENAAVALALLWPGFSRQLVVRGTVEEQDRAGSARAYAARSPYLRQLAWQNTAALAAEDGEARAVAWGRFASDRDVRTLEAPPNWTGFVVLPDRLTFWRSDPSGPSHRVEYSAETSRSWSERHLAG